jgi:hypothetical protein
MKFIYGAPMEPNGTRLHRYKHDAPKGTGGVIKTVILKFKIFNSPFGVPCFGNAVTML